MTIRNWQRPETVPIWVTVKDPVTEAAVDPSEGVKVTITNPSGTKIIDAQAMAKSAVGSYVYYWNSALDSIVGWYKTRVSAQDGTGAVARITIQLGGFELE